MIPPTSIDGTDITGATIDGTDVQEITVDGQTVFSPSFLPYGFEDNILTDKFTGNLNPFQISTTRAIEGSRSLFVNSDPGGDKVLPKMYSNIGNVITPGETYQIRFYQEDNASNFHVGGPDINNNYGVQINTGDNGLPGGVISVANNGSTSFLGDPGFDAPRDEWGFIEIDWPFVGQFTVTILDASQNVFYQETINDSSHSGGGFGFGTHETPDFYWDDLKVI